MAGISALLLQALSGYFIMKIGNILLYYAIFNFSYYGEKYKSQPS